MKPKRIQRRRAKNWQMPPNTVYVGRPGKWGNPFVVGLHGTRLYCTQLFASLMAGYVCVGIKGKHPDKQSAYYEMVRRDIGHLRGKNLACWCPLNQPCHADILLKIANG